MTQSAGKPGRVDWRAADMRGVNLSGAMLDPAKTPHREHEQDLGYERD